MLESITCVEQEDNVRTSPENTATHPAGSVAISECDEDSTSESSDPLERIVKRVAATVLEGAPRCLSRAAQQCMQQPPAPLTPEIIQQLRNLHPAPMMPMPVVGDRNMEPELVAVDQAALLKILQRRVNNGSAPGPSGWTGAHLQLLAERGSEGTVAGLCALVQDLCNGTFDGQLKERLLSSTLLPIWKKVGQTIRPIAIGEVFVRLAAHFSMSLIEEELPSLFPRIQFGVRRPGGSETAVQLTRALIEESRRHHPSTIALALDVRNAFNTLSRAEAWKALQGSHATRPIHRMFLWAYSDPSALLLFEPRGKLHSQLASQEGMRQGDPLASFVFALTVQPMYEAAIKNLPDCHAVSVLDDLTLTGPAEQVMQAFERIKLQAPTLGLELQVAKCKAFTPPQMEAAAPEVLARIRSNCASAGLECHSHMEALGVMFGSDTHIEAHLATTVDSHRAFLDILTHPKMPAQIAAALLRQSALPRLGFLARTTHPDNFQAAASKFDGMIERTAECVFNISRHCKTALPSALVTAEQIDERISLPLSLGGLGLRPFTRISHAAYFASLAVTTPLLCAAFPGSHMPSTGVHQELLTCRQHILTQWAPHEKQNSLAHIHEETYRAELPRHASRARSSVSLYDSTTPPSKSGAGTSLILQQLFETDDLAQLWHDARLHSSPLTRTHDFLRDSQLQHELTHRIELQLYERHFRSCSLYQRTILTALNLNRNTSAWLTALPTAFAYRLRDSTFRLATRHRLGLLPFDSLKGRTKCHRSCASAPSSSHFNSDPAHLHSCFFNRGSPLNQRHNDLAATLGKLAQLAGFVVVREPMHHLRGESQVTPGSEKWNEHSDLLFLKEDRRLYVEVSVARPTGNMFTRNATATWKPLVAAQHRTVEKRKKYAELAARNDYELLVFAGETYGGLSHEGRRLLRILASHAPAEIGERVFLTHAYRAVSCCLQRGNALLEQGAIQRMLVEDARYEAHRQSAAACYARAKANAA